MNDEKQAAAAGPVLSDGLGPLVGCPFCGSCDGYKLAEGSTYRWWLVQCKTCGAGVTECHSDRRTLAGTTLPDVWPAAHEGWNDAGAHAHKLRTLLARYRDETPLGHQPHMIAHEADAALGRGPNASSSASAENLPEI